MKPMLAMGIQQMSRNTRVRITRSPRFSFQMAKAVFNIPPKPAAPEFMALGSSVRSEPQCLHLRAPSITSSLQYGHCILSSFDTDEFERNRHPLVIPKE